MGLFCSCVNTKNSITPQPIIEKNPKIIFLNYNIKKTLGASKNITFTGKTIVDGKLKKNEKIKKDTHGDLICLQLDKKSNILQRTIIKNPLLKIIEFIDDTKSFQTKRINLDSANFSIRLQLKQNAQYISIIESTPNMPVSKPLITTQINER